MAGVRIKDAEPVTMLKDVDQLPISDGGQKEKSVNIGLMKSHINKEVNAKLDEAITSELYVPTVK